MGPKNAPMNEWPSLVEIMGLDLEEIIPKIQLKFQQNWTKVSSILDQN